MKYPCYDQKAKISLFFRSVLSHLFKDIIPKINPSSPLNLVDYSVIVVQLLSLIRLFETHGLQHARLPCPSPSPGACSNSCPLNQDYPRDCIISPLINFSLS